MSAATLIVGAISPASRAQEVRLAWRWRQGDERHYVIESTFKQSIVYDRSGHDPSRPDDPNRPARPAPRPASDPDTTRRIDCTQILNVVERVVSVDERGVATVTQTYERVRVQGTDSRPEGTETFTYDSASRGAPGAERGSEPTSAPPARTIPPPGQSPRQRLNNPLPTTSPTAPPSRRPADSPPGPARRGTDNPDHPLILPFASLAGRTITYRIDGEGKVLSCEGGEAAMEAVFSPMEGDSPFNPLVMLFKTAVTNESLAQQCQQGLSLIPNRYVRRGETWPLSVRQTLPLVGALRTEATCRLLGVRGGEGSQSASIENKGQMILEGGDSGVQSLGGLFQIHLCCSEMTGTTDFDVEGGFVRAQRQHLVSQWEAYCPDWEDLDRLGEPMKITQSLEQDMTLRLEP